MRIAAVPPSALPRPRCEDSFKWKWTGEKWEPIE